MNRGAAPSRNWLSPFASSRAVDTTVTAMSAPVWWRYLEVGLPTVVLLATLGTLAAFRFSLTLPRLSALVASHETATPFFSLEAFRTVNVSMTEAEVREAVGYPLRRIMPSESEQIERILWVYTMPTGSRAGYFRHCLVTFDVHTRRVVRVHERDAAFSPGAVPWWTGYVHRTVGTLRLSGVDGRDLVLTPERREPCLIVLDPGWPLERSNGLATTYGAYFRNALADAGLARLDVAVLRVRGFGIYAPEPTAPTPDVFRTSDPPLGPVEEPLCLLYFRGDLYGLPNLEWYYPPDEWAPDVRWLLVRLTGGTGDAGVESGPFTTAHEAVRRSDSANRRQGAFRPFGS